MEQKNLELIEKRGELEDTLATTIKFFIVDKAKNATMIEK